ncbi:endo-1,4-beta-xylanase [Miniimonas sp. S16]|uniref:endo-1,4-beta-xylanase n=1 Tax=Miniimonas sp. S16 TaxID=2171623 RepID=UPI000D52900F|nr:endo-1,4-beta-xylanase [Miniimonas sp. S16]
MSLEDRLTSTRVVVADLDGRPVPGQQVEVAQVRHAFEFGCAAFEVAQADQEYQDLFLGLFDTATLPFYWGRFEPRRGEPHTAELLAAARWFQERGVRLKGHPLVWHTVKAEWVDPLPLAEAEAELRARIRREVGDFAGLVDTWDAINEVVIMPRFTNEPDGVTNAITRLCQDRGRVEMVRLAVDEARSVGTRPRLVLNDFDLGPEYEDLVAQVLDAGIEIDAIGLQSHMHQGFRGVEQLVEICDRFARFGLPLHWTETTLVSGDLMPPEIEDLNDYVVQDWPSTPEGEARQAAEAVAHYTTLVSHPAVESITYWGMGDAGTWLGAPAGLVRADGTAKPAYDALRSLIRGEWWWAPRTLVTGPDGAVQVDGFAGRYAITAGGATTEVDLDRGPGTTTVTLTS